MADLTVSVLVSRDRLGLDDLQINDHLDYIIAGPDFLGGQQSWDRTQVSSPFADGEVTVNRRRQNVQENILLEVLGSSTADVHANAKAVVNAFSQDTFTITVSINSSSTVYECEASDYRIVTSSPRYAASQLQVSFTVPHKPLVGGI
jgi:hypothetical protein